MTEPDDLRARKAALREQARKARVAQPDKDAVSAAVLARAVELPEYAAAGVIMYYVDAGSEVRTRQALPDAIASGKTVVVPYCLTETTTLALFRLESMDELIEGAYRILEPREGLRAAPGKSVQPGELDLVLVPGTAFDRRGGRMGQGKGYYDRLLAGVRPGVPLVALAFECQMLAEVPMAPHDRFMDIVVTEAGIYRVTKGESQ